MGNGCSSNSTALASGKRQHASDGDPRPNTLTSVVLGGKGGDYFKEESVYSLGFNVGNVIDAMFLNGKKHGGDGGSPAQQVLILGPEEYINYIQVEHGDKIDNIIVKTNQGRTFNPKANRATDLQSTRSSKLQSTLFTVENCRLIAIGGKADKKLDQLQLKYLANYTPSETPIKQCVFLYQSFPGGTTLESFSSSSIRSLRAISQGYNTTTTASSSAEYWGSVSTSFEVSFTTTYEVETELEAIEKLSSKETIVVPQGQLLVQYGNGTVHASERDASTGIYKDCWAVPVPGTFDDTYITPEILANLTADGDCIVDFNRTVQRVPGYDKVLERAPGYNSTRFKVYQKKTTKAVKAVHSLA